MTTQVPPDLLLPLTPEQLALLQAATTDFNSTQLVWLSGYFWGMVNQTTGVAMSKSAKASIELPIITLISASQTGNARRLAEQLHADLLAAKLNVNLVNAGDYKFKQISQEKLLVVVTSTQGEGEPPDEAMALHKFLMSKKAPKFKGTSFAVFGLGDTSYEFFSQIGKDFDNRLFELGADRMLDRVDADVEYKEQASAWRRQIIEILKERVTSKSTMQSTLTVADIVNKRHISPYTKEQPLTASVAVNQKITGRNSDKDVRHIEIDLGNSSLSYQPGDALGVWYENDAELVQELIQLVCLKGDELVKMHDRTLPLVDTLQKCFELTVNTPQIVKKYAALSRNKVLLELTDDKQKLKRYAQIFPIVDMIRQVPTALTTEQLTDLLRPLTPRLYSISSAQSECKTEVHITVGVVRYEIDGRIRGGGASTWLADHIKEDDEIRIFVEKNNNFHLPSNLNTPIIMIGSGTGIAPFRAFMQQRNNDNAVGKNWLFFGNPHFTEDFLYQIEWQKYVKDGLLTNIDLAWSRDQADKIYVQDKIRRKGIEVWCWIKDGAHIYVCGDANRMAKDVEQALLDVVVKHGCMYREMANEFLSKMRIERRYQRDIY